MKRAQHHCVGNSKIFRCSFLSRICFVIDLRTANATQSQQPLLLKYMFVDDFSVGFACFRKVINWLVTEQR